jgi:hypothetical protein
MAAVVVDDDHFHIYFDTQRIYQLLYKKQVERELYEIQVKHIS